MTVISEGRTVLHAGSEPMAAELVAANGPLAGRKFAIDAEAGAIGRDESCEIVLTGDQQVSRRHARIWCDDSLVRIEDLGSCNGIVVNGRIVRAAALRHGDIVTVGGTQFTVHAPSAVPDWSTAGELDPETRGTIVMRPDITTHSESVIDPAAREAAHAHVEILYRIGQDIGAVRSTETLLQQIVDALFEEMTPTR